MTLRAFFSAVLALAGAAGPAIAETASPWAEGAYSRARLIAGESAVGGDGVASLALEIELDVGWKTYWRTPGEAGLPPLFDWSASTNVEAARLTWPTPKRFSSFGLDSYGYHDRLILPIDVALAAPGEAVMVDLDLAYAVCSDICVPADARLALNLPAGAGEATVFAPRIARERAKAPATREEGAGFSVSAIRIDPAGPALVVEIEGPFAADADLFVEGARGASFGRPSVTEREDGGVLRVPISTKDADPPPPQELTLTISNGAHALELTRMVGP